MFDSVVKLYRLLGKPSFDEAHSFEVTVPKSTELLVELEAVKSMDASYGSFSYRERGDCIRVEGQLPQNGEAHFFTSIEDFIEGTPSLNLGVIRKNFYIRDSDYSSSDDLTKCHEVNNITRIVDFVRVLRNFASINLEDNQGVENRKIIFLKAADGKSVQQAVVLKINIVPSLISFNIKGYLILSDLKNEKSKQKIHIEERILLINNAISDIISECVDDDKDFEYLVENWDRVIRKYAHDFHAYMNGFSFDAIRKKISDSVIDSSTKINNALGDIGVKILAVPLSVAGLVALQESKNEVSFWFGLLAVFIASLTLSKTVNHYSDQLNNLIKSFEFNLEVSSLSKKTFGAVIRKELKRIDDYIDGQKIKISKTINLYRIVVWLPMIFSVGFVVNRYFDELDYFFNVFRYCGTSYFWWKELTSYFVWMKF